MKYSKAAAVVAGSLVALGAASVVSTAHAAEAGAGGRPPGGHGTQTTTSAPNTQGGPLAGLTGQNLGPLDRVTQRARGLLGKTPATQGIPARGLGVTG